jgi:sialic acid synthase SpsE
MTLCACETSFENSDIPRIRRVDATGKPMIISTGMATVAELDESVRAARTAGNKNFILLKYASTYPATSGNSNVLAIPHMKDLLGCNVGFSGHVLGGCCVSN